MNDSIARTLEEIFREVFSDARLMLDPQMTASDVRGWDSLNHMHLIAETERRFGIRFTFDEARGLQNVGDLIRLVEEKTAC